MLIFSVSISFKKLNADSTHSITFLNLRKHTGIVFKTGNHGVVISDLPQTDKNFLYAVQPGLDSSRITDLKVYTLTDDINLPYLQKRNGYVNFQNKKMLLLNGDSKIQSIPQHLDIDYLFISGNAFIETTILKHQTVIINADNTNKYINTLTRQLSQINVNYDILKRNKSVCIVSNPHNK